MAPNGDCRLSTPMKVPDPLETGGGMAKALPLLGPDPFLLVNGDVWCDLDFSTLSLKLWEPTIKLCFILVQQPQWRDRGDFALENDRVTESENPQFFILRHCTLSPLDSGRSTSGKILHRTTLKKSNFGQPRGWILHSGEWDDVGTPEALKSHSGNATAAGEE